MQQVLRSRGAGDDEMRTGYGDGDVDGGTGFDRYAAAATCCDGVRIDVAAATLTRLNGGPTFTFVGIESVTGTRWGDLLLGGALADVLAGWLGDDQLAGRGGADTLRGGDGDDAGKGGSGVDRCVGVEVPSSCET